MFAVSKSIVTVVPRSFELILFLQVTLTGPFSPLEHKLACLHRHGVSKAASVEFRSVNAVLLDAAGSSFDQLMVAAHVNVSAAGDRLSLRRWSISNENS